MDETLGDARVNVTPAEALAATVVDELARCGVTDACLAPGSRSAPLALALHAEPRIRLHVRIDERSASFVALGLARATARPAVVLSTSGTAAANFFPAVIEAHHARLPLIVLTADRPPELRDTGANQTIDQTKLFGGAARWWAELHSEVHPGADGHFRSVAAGAWQHACGSPPGPVHVNMSLREPLIGDSGGHPQTALGGRTEGRPSQIVTSWSAPAPDSVIEQMAARISKTRRGLIVAGDGAVAPAPVAALARSAGWPVLAEPTSGLRSFEGSISTYDALLRSAWASAHRPDLVIRLGKSGTSKSLLAWLDPTIEQVLIDAVGARLDPTRSIAEIVRADPDIFAEQIVKAIDARDESDWMASWSEADACARTIIDDILDAEDEPSEPRIARDLADLLPEGATLVAASSMPVRDLDSFMRVRPGLRVTGNRGASGIDGFISTAVGVALASAGPVAALAGDLSMLHDAGGLATLGGPRPDLTFVVLNNDGGGIFSFLPQAARTGPFEKLFGTPHGIDMGQLASLYGCGYTLLQSARELGPVLDEPFGGIRIIEARTDRTKNYYLHQRIWQAVGRALGDLR
jgi:2-succinyl-5-enolpyruvyl-6-hydroxy-3-cyclohexene-1-carboxylate synthase